MVVTDEPTSEELPGEFLDDDGPPLPSTVFPSDGIEDDHEDGKTVEGSFVESTRSKHSEEEFQAVVQNFHLDNFDLLTRMLEDYKKQYDVTSEDKRGKNPLEKNSRGGKSQGSAAAAGKNLLESFCNQSVVKYFGVCKRVSMMALTKVAKTVVSHRGAVADGMGRMSSRLLPLAVFSSLLYTAGATPV